MSLKLRRDSGLRQVCEKLAAKHDLPELVVKDVLTDGIGLILSAARESGRFQLRGIGVFRRRDMPARPARNLHTGERIMVPPRSCIAFAEETREPKASPAAHHEG